MKAFRDTWKDGIHSYLTYLRDRLTVMRELLHETGSVFVQIGDENVHRVRAVMDEVFGDANFISAIMVQKTGGLVQSFLPGTADYILFYGKNRDQTKYRQIFIEKPLGGASLYRKIRLPNGDVRQMTKEESGDPSKLPEDVKVYRHTSLESANPYFDFEAFGTTWRQRWKTSTTGLARLVKSARAEFTGRTLHYVRYHEDFPISDLTNGWGDTQSGGFNEPTIYVVQTTTKTVQRCILMATDPGDLVLDPTCGSGTTAYVAEQWGRRWITLDTSRVALALARTRLMSARYPYYLMADSPEGRRKEQEVSGAAQPMSNAQGDIRQGFVYERAPHVTLKSIANNAEIDVIWEQWQAKLEPLREALNRQTSRDYQEWEIPREVQVGWDDTAITLHRDWWDARIARQKEIDASIAKRADVELLYDRPYEDKTKVRVAGPFTVESLSPHRVVPSDADAAWDEVQASEGKRRRNLVSAPPADFAQIVLENLKTSGVQQGAKADRIEFTSLTPWPGRWIAADGRYLEGPEGEQVERRAAIFIGPEFGTASRPDLTAAAREATDARFDVLIAAAFNFEAHASELNRLGPLQILRAKINPDLHMAGELKNTGKGNLFIVFGEPDVEIETVADDQLQVKVLGVDVFDPNTGDIRSGDTKSIAAWFIDTDYDEESFFVRHAYFLGANDPYKSLKTALKAEIDEIAWSTLYRDVSRPFDRPSSGRIAVKVINHFGDEVMKVFRV